MKKYELALETEKTFFGIKMFRIRALVSFSNVKINDLGGYIEKENNLTQDGNAWVYGDAQVYGNAWVSGNARVYGDAQVYGNARVYCDAQVYGNARVYGDAQVSGNARVYCDAQVYGNARVYGDAWVSGNAKIDSKIFNIIGPKHSITITKTHIFIGCEGHTIEHWRKNIVKIGKKNGYTDLEIKQTIGLIKAVLNCMKGTV